MFVLMTIMGCLVAALGLGYMTFYPLWSTPIPYTLLGIGGAMFYFAHLIRRSDRIIGNESHMADRGQSPAGQAAGTGLGLVSLCIVILGLVLAVVALAAEFWPNPSAPWQLNLPLAVASFLWFPALTGLIFGVTSWRANGCRRGRAGTAVSGVLLLLLVITGGFVASH